MDFFSTIKSVEAAGFAVTAQSTLGLNLNKYFAQCQHVPNAQYLKSRLLSNSFYVWICVHKDHAHKGGYVFQAASPLNNFCLLIQSLFLKVVAEVGVFVCGNYSGLWKWSGCVLA